MNSLRPISAKKTRWSLNNFRQLPMMLRQEYQRVQGFLAK
jgi:hypothetical protein